MPACRERRLVAIGRTVLGTPSTLPRGTGNPTALRQGSRRRLAAIAAQDNGANWNAGEDDPPHQGAADRRPPLRRWRRRPIRRPRTLCRTRHAGPCRLDWP